jgi:hypothetical protein
VKSAAKRSLYDHFPRRWRYRRIEFSRAIVMRLRAFLMLFSALPALCVAAPAIGMFTVVEGEAVVIRDSVRFAATEGLPLQADDIVHTADSAQFVRMELAQGGVIDVGPATRLLLRPRFAQPGDRPALAYMLQGWVKLTAPATQKISLASARMDLTELAGVAVVRVADDLSFVFAESGAAKLVERGGQARAHQLAGGQAYERRGNEEGAVLSRPAADVVKAMPRAFADSLPLRAKRFQDAQVAPVSPVEIGYDDVAAWINAERALRPAFVQRWTGKARDPKFRSALIADLRSHPEWDRVLFPEKYAPKPRPALAASAPAPAAPPPAPVVTTLPEPKPLDPDRDPLRPWEVRRR